MPFLFELLPFPCLLAWRRPETGDRFERGNGRGFFLPYLSQPVRRCLPLQHTKNCAALLCRALRRVDRMCSRTISGTAYRFRHGSTLCSPTVEKILCRSLFSKRSHIGNLRQIRKQGKGRSSKRKGNRRCPFLFAHRRGYGAVPAAGAAISRAPQSATPSLNFSEKLSVR